MTLSYPVSETLTALLDRIPLIIVYLRVGWPSATVLTEAHRVLLLADVARSTQVPIDHCCQRSTTCSTYLRRQVKRMMVYQDMDLQENLLHSAISSGSTDAFDTVLSSLTSRLTPTEVRTLTRPLPNRRRLSNDYRVGVETLSKTLRYLQYQR